MDLSIDTAARHCLAVLRYRIRRLRISDTPFAYPIDRDVVTGTFRRTGTLLRLIS